MAMQLRPQLNSLPLSSRTQAPLSTTVHSGATSNRRLTIRCGPRDNRGPLVKGRVLSSEAIHAVQALKRAQRSPNPPEVSRTLSRLIKADLLATLRELLRQGHCDLALKVFSTVRSESWYKTDLGLYADLVLALAKDGMMDDIDRLIGEMEMEDGVIDFGDKKGLSRLIKALIGAERRESTVRIYGVMKRSGWGCTGSRVEVDEYVAKVLSKGLRRFGEMDLARQVDLALENYATACLGRVEAQIMI